MSRGKARFAQRGIVLVVALVLLAVMSLGAMASFRSALTASVFSDNVRSQALALQAAEQALRYCELQLNEPDSAVAVQPLPVSGSGEPELWRMPSVWRGPQPLASAVPQALVRAAGPDIPPDNAPQCLIEEMLLPRVKGAAESAAYLVTARGFSPDYQRDELGAVAGAEVWVQSVIRQ